MAWNLELLALKFHCTAIVNEPPKTQRLQSYVFTLQMEPRWRDQPWAIVCRWLFGVFHGCAQKPPTKCVLIPMPHAAILMWRLRWS